MAANRATAFILIAVLLSSLSGIAKASAASSSGAPLSGGSSSDTPSVQGAPGCCPGAGVGELEIDVLDHPELDDMELVGTATGPG